MPHRLRRETRPRAFAATELVLNAMHVLREASRLDHESIVIGCLINSAAMRTLLIGPAADLEYMDIAAPPDELRGAISRAAVADILGISRETTRRKINAMIDAGQLIDAGCGKVRPVSDLANPMWEKVEDDIHAAAQKYHQRLVGLGCAGVTD